MKIDGESSSTSDSCAAYPESVEEADEDSRADKEGDGEPSKNTVDPDAWMTKAIFGHPVCAYSQSVHPLPEVDDEEIEALFSRDSVLKAITDAESLDHLKKQFQQTKEENA